MAPRNSCAQTAAPRKICVVSHENIMTRSSRASRSALLLATIVLSIILPVYSLRTSRALAEMQQIYLRDRASRIADRLERVPPEQLASAAVADGLRRQEPGLVAFRSYQEK